MTPRRKSLAHVRAAGLLCLLLGGSMSPLPAPAWDVRCEDPAGVECPDAFASVRTEWRAHPRAEHRRLLERSIEVSGLPPQLQDPFNLDVFVDDARTVRTAEGTTYTSIQPVLRGATKREQRTVTIPMFANLPDFSYTLWDWTSGNELCPPDPANTDPFDCHDYKTHIGWLNSNHMLPQSRRWYEHLHALALERAAQCKAEYDRTPADALERMRRYHMACERLALVLEGVGHHYLQDSWALGHMWERWGGTEIHDFLGNRALGFHVGFFTGTLHGAKAVLDDTPGLSVYAPWDDPLNAPHPLTGYRDGATVHPGVGDMFLPALLGLDDTLPAAPQYDYTRQRRSLLGCAVSGLREVYAATGQLHGPMTAALANEADLSRSVRNDSCWAQRATNLALATGFGFDQGPAPVARPALNYLPMAFAMTASAAITGGQALVLDSATLLEVQRDASYSVALAIAKSKYPPTTFDTDLASGGLPSLALIAPNSHYERGYAALKGPPASYADPFLPWRVLPTSTGARPGKLLNLTFADANAGERCGELTVPELEAWRSAAQAATEANRFASARCGQCVQMVAPHLRRGRDGNFDVRRDAYCAVIGVQNAAFVYTDEDPTSFTGSEAVSFSALSEATERWCGCTPPVSVSITPLSPSVALGETVQLSAAVTGTADARVTWELPDGGGVITAGGLFTAGATAGNFRIRAVSVADRNAFAEAFVNVTVLSAAGRVIQVTDRVFADRRANPDPSLHGTSTSTLSVYMTIEADAQGFLTVRDASGTYSMSAELFGTISGCSSQSFAGNGVVSTVGTFGHTSSDAGNILPQVDGSYTTTLNGCGPGPPGPPTITEFSESFSLDYTVIRSGDGSIVELDFNSIEIIEPGTGRLDPRTTITTTGRLGVSGP